MSTKQRLFIVADEDGDELVTQLAQAANSRDLTCALVLADRADPLDLPQLGPGDMLYRVGTSHRACVAEQLLYSPETATFYEDPLGPHLQCDTQTLWLARRGIPVPRALYTLPKGDAELRAAVEALGGFPVVLKQPGHSLGVGVMLLDNWVSLRSVVDGLREAMGDQVTMMAAIEDSVHWRVIVLGDAVAASYINPVRPEDFRTHVIEQDPSLFTATPKADVERIAIDAVVALRLSFGGVDVLVHPSGQMYVLEVNFPCYFGHPARAVGLDVAGAMVDALLLKSSRLSGL